MEIGHSRSGRDRRFHSLILLLIWLKQPSCEARKKSLKSARGRDMGLPCFRCLSLKFTRSNDSRRLAHRACELLKKLDFGNVHVHIGDGSLGLPHEAPFDAIIVTAAGKCLPSAYVDQLTDGGRIVIPIGQQKSSQHLYRIYRKRGEVIADDLGRFAFVPLIGDQGWESP